jgi:hypothetical protein
MTDLAEHASLGVRKLEPTIQLHFEDAVLGDQIFVPRQQLLTYAPSGVYRFYPKRTFNRRALFVLFSSRVVTRGKVSTPWQ